MRCRLAIGIIALAGAVRFAPAAEIFYLDHDVMTHEYTGPVGPLVFSGEIVVGDYDRLVARVAENRAQFLATGKILLAGDAGDLGEAIKIATLVKSLSAEVVVGPVTGRCSGACFMIYAAAEQRFTDGRGLLGVSRPELVEAQLEPLSPEDAKAVEAGAVAWARAYLEQNAVPASLVREMQRHAAGKEYWLSDDDERELGTISPSLRQLLTEKCGWTESLEHDVYQGARPMADLQAVWKCRAELMQPVIRNALDVALKGEPARDAKVVAKVEKDAVRDKHVAKAARKSPAAQQAKTEWD
jgi:hypothetical protein